MKSGTQYVISDERGEKLRNLLQQGTKKEFINLDGRGMMVKTTLIEKVVAEKPLNPVTEAWKEAIRRNLKVMRETGHMGRLTADDVLGASVKALA